ncbi:GGDEF domain-containing protein [Hyphomonas johnsonii]|uniref:diguanylate cyclase n=1 Tax=Hyphomonas johnsonii MHS-2 TaxID=1280950 RepID=A0A059FPY2_9PROT|nr:GGDEF domain-containing protein [Hyphomonas johnsonii]KCZ92677.1 diguanylate cyclase [Hyphomonas johnsonii MHS-2]
MAINDHKQDLFDSLTFFAFVAITALCLSFTFSMVVYHFGIPQNPETFVLTNLLVSACVAIPTATLASQHEFRLKMYQHRLETLASIDPLTGISNRRYFKQTVDEELKRMRRTQQTAGLVIFDLDHFKRVNDRHGHKAGDAVLQEVAAIAFAELRGPFDRLGRWGGEEFVILLSNVTLEQSTLVCERIREKIAALTIDYKGTQLSVTASFGTCLLGVGSTLDLAMETADLALFESKRAGRNQVNSRRTIEIAA